MDAESVALMLINRQRTVGHQRFSIAHELCHHLHHKGRNTWVCRLDDTPKGDYEREANESAAALLLPAGAVGDLFASCMEEDGDLARAALRVCTHYRASWQSTVYRLSNLGLISATDRDFLVSMSVTSLARQLGVRSDVWAAETAAKVPSEFAQLAKYLRDASAISDRKYTSMLENLEAFRECAK